MQSDEQFNGMVEMADSAARKLGEYGFSLRATDVRAVITDARTTRRELVEAKAEVERMRDELNRMSDQYRTANDAGHGYLDRADELNSELAQANQRLEQARAIIGEMDACFRNLGAGGIDGPLPKKCREFLASATAQQPAPSNPEPPEGMVRVTGYVGVGRSGEWLLYGRPRFSDKAQSLLIAQWIGDEHQLHGVEVLVPSYRPPQVYEGTVVSATEQTKGEAK